MEMESEMQSNGSLARTREWIKGLPVRLKCNVVKLAKKTKKLGQDDPRRVTHSLKVGLAISLVSLFYYFQPLYDGFGDSAMWAVLTVVVVFEFSVGATLGRGLNRGLATFVAGALGFGAHHLATLSGKKGEPILLGLFVFLLATTATFFRFFPKMKARYDYGMLIFILTFCLISVSGYRDDEVLEMAHKRVSTILIGGFTAVLVCIFVWPVWAGDDLHNLVANNIQKLGCLLEGFGVETVPKSGCNKASMEGYKNVLNSKNIEESMANFARWEPGHGKFKFRHPWKQYLKIGSLTRQCAYKIDALNGYLVSDIQAKSEIEAKIKEKCKKMSSDSGKILNELATAIKTMTKPSSAISRIVQLKNAANNLKSLLKTSLRGDSEIDILGIVPVAAISSLFIEVVSSTEKIAESVQELASLAQFKNAELKIRKQESRVCDQGEKQLDTSNAAHDHVIVIE